MNIGVLALQGAFREHKGMFEHLVGATVTEVRFPEHLAGLQGLVIPGGESTTMAKLMQSYSFDKAIPDFYKQGGALWGTCAGAIAISKEIVGYPEQPRLHLMDIAVERNAYGRQVASFETDVTVAGLEQPFHVVFIRAPRIASVGKNVKVLASFKDNAIMVQEGKLMATVFHPELTNDSRIHRYFLENVVAAV
ncbi:MAG: pyridoxal 5'-phosphate synthase glutaminase subunit PdxT [Trueperaceae bacterium]